MVAPAKEAEEPSGDNLPEPADDPRAEREWTNCMGTRLIVWESERSFIQGNGPAQFDPNEWSP